MKNSSRRGAFSVLILAAGLFCLADAAAQNAHVKKGGSIVVPPKQFKAAAPSADSSSGKVIFEKDSCLTCHSITGKGGCLAPPLDGIGAYRSREFIVSRIAQGPDAARKFQETYGAELMPHLRVKAADAAKIAAYLLTLPEPKEGVRISTHPVGKPAATTKPAAKTDKVNLAKASVDKGKLLFNVKGCTSCHSINNIGGHFAPALDDVAKTRSAQYVTERINRAEFLTQTDEYSGRGSMMPPLNLNPEEIKSITAFLMSLPGKSK